MRWTVRAAGQTRQAKESEESGEPDVRGLEPDRCVSEAAGEASWRRVKLVVRDFGFG